MSANPWRIAGIALILAGALALAYGGFTYTRHTDDIKVGPIELSIKEKETFSVPMWAGLGAIAIGAVLLLGLKKD
jgi:hypothetical protein